MATSRLKRRRLDWFKECFKDSVHYLTYQVSSGGSISKGEYDLAVRVYKRAKYIALSSHVNILKRVLEEVEKVMPEFKSILYRSMKDPQSYRGSQASPGYSSHRRR